MRNWKCMTCEREADAGAYCSSCAHHGQGPESLFRRPTKTISLYLPIRDCCIRNMAKGLVVVLIVLGMGVSLGGCMTSTLTPSPTQTSLLKITSTSKAILTPTPPPLPTQAVSKESTPAPDPTVSLSMTATVTPADDLEDEIYVQFSGEASHRMGSSRRDNFYETPPIPLKGYHLEAGFLCYIFERVPDDPEYIGWPGWALYFSRERSNGNVGSSGLAYDMRNSGHRDCVAIGHGHGDDRPDRISTVPRYRNFFRVERPEGSWKLTVCTSRVDLTGKVRYVSSSGRMQGWIEKKSFECPPPDG